MNPGCLNPKPVFPTTTALDVGVLAWCWTVKGLQVLGCLGAPLEAAFSVLLKIRAAKLAVLLSVVGRGCLEAMGRGRWVWRASYTLCDLPKGRGSFLNLWRKTESLCLTAPAPSGPHPPPHGDCAGTATPSLPPHQRRHHGPLLGHQLCFHVPAKSGHHRAGTWSREGGSMSGLPSGNRPFGRHEEAGTEGERDRAVWGRLGSWFVCLSPFPESPSLFAGIGGGAL